MRARGADAARATHLVRAAEQRRRDEEAVVHLVRVRDEAARLRL
jgi:hypothetical protein